MAEANDTTNQKKRPAKDFQKSAGGGGDGGGGGGGGSSKGKDNKEGHQKKKFKQTTTTGGGGGYKGKKPQPQQHYQPQQQQSNGNSKTPFRPRRHADVVERGKALWNQLRLKTNTPEQTRELVDELLPLIEGKAKEIALQHDASRIVQAAIQFGTPAERRSILRELCGVDVDQDKAKTKNMSALAPTPTSGSNSASGNKNKNSDTTLVELCKSQYAHFVVLKVLQYCHGDDECCGLVVKQLKGHVAKLAVHAVASRVVESLFSKLPKSKLVPLKQELYGPHFSLFAVDVVPAPQQQSPNQKKKGVVMPTLASNLESASLSQKQKDLTIEFVRHLVHKGTEKTLFGYSYFQELFAEFLEFAPPSEIRAMAASVADHGIHLLSTKAGTRVVASMVTYGTAKDRKRILKGLKGYGRSGLLHADAYLAFLRLVQLTDDTVSIQKNLLNELLTKAKPAEDPLGLKKKKVADEAEDGKATASPLLDLALSETASKLFLMLLEDDDDVRHKFFDPSERSVLEPENPTVTENGEEVPTSKKDPKARRQELLAHLKDPLVGLCADHAPELLRSRPGAVVFREVYQAFRPETLVEAAVDACVAALADTDNNDEEKEKLFPLLEDRDGHLAIKNLVLADVTTTSDEAEEGSSFAVDLYERLKSDFGSGGAGLMEVAGSNRGAFVVAALCKVPSVQQRVREDLRQNASALQKLAKGKEGGGATAGYAALVNEISAKTKTKKNRKSQ